jgi:hypothetical protein
VRKFFLQWAVVVVLCAVCFAQGDRAESIGSVSDNAVGEAVRQSLDSKGYRLVLADGTQVGEVWLRRELPEAPKKESAGILYSQLSESELVGVIHFPEAATDFRGQAVAAGFYTLRYGLMPSDGNHLGAAPSRDFLLLIPSASDPDPSSKFDFQKLMSLSRQASASKHPAILSMVLPGEGKTAALSQDEEDHTVFSGSIKMSGGTEMPIAFVVKGVVQQQ